MKELFNYCYQPRAYADSSGYCLVELEEGETTKSTFKERNWGVIMKYKETVYDTSVKEIEKLNGLTDEEIKRNPHILKVSQLKNSHVLSIIKQQEIDYKMKDLELRTTMYEIRNERNNIMKDNIKLQEQKIKWDGLKIG